MSTKAWVLGGLLLAIAGCARDGEPARAAHPATAGADVPAAPPIGSANPGTPPGDPPATSRASAGRFASLPDRGDLAGYPAKRVVRREDPVAGDRERIAIGRRAQRAPCRQRTAGCKSTRRDSGIP